MSASDVRSFPRVDDHLVRPETREELVRGRMMLALPADVARATCHSMVNYVTRGAIAPGYVGAAGLLTRFGLDSDLGTDTCIRREGIDPTTGARYLEELVIEVVHRELLADLAERAEILTARGVRRVVAILVDEQEAREWQAGAWVPLDPRGTLDDPTLEPIPVRAVFNKAEADRSVLRALRTKKDPDLMVLEAEAFEQARPRSWPSTS